MADCNENKEKQTPDMLKKAEEYLASKRRIFLWGGVDDESAERIVKHLVPLRKITEKTDSFTLFGRFFIKKVLSSVFVLDFIEKTYILL